ncbi:MAG: Na(+)-translocating NADH-quinone reductase subunit A [Dysgonamonadaceae bacterium]|jgi:Na+-transporting NADH:ubiquinone oxidoreductase subunit A|nr:Na(+)-translocating NADH-quinone reductase subunit A [Dysgonamonadaceae bacterium]
MNQAIKINRGLDINLKGKPEMMILQPVQSGYYTIFPDDFTGFSPKIAVKQGDQVSAGTMILYDKNDPDIKIVSPVSGEIVSVNRGEKRKLLCIVISVDKEMEYRDFEKKNVLQLTAEEIRKQLCEAGIFPFIRQRPYGYGACPSDVPRDIFISGIYSAPLAPSLELILKDQEADFQTGLDALAQLTPGKVYLGIHADCNIPALNKARNVEQIRFEGPHPVGNVGVQINHIKPINKGEIVWTIDPSDVLFIGRLFNKGIADFTRLVALCGSEVKKTGYHRMLPGVSIKNLVENNTTEGIALRYISGNVLTGTRIDTEGHLHAFDNQITVIPEGSETSEFLGWASLGFNKFSNSCTFPSRFIRRLTGKEFVLDARIKGGKRAMIMSNEYDKVFPMDIFPEFLLKAIIAFDIDKMENLGIYEVIPEDFALCEFVDTSKIELQSIVRKGLDLLYNEMK